MFLSYLLDKNSPSYGNRNKFEISKKSDISKGDVANDSHMSTTVHIGTHIDMPYHFYREGQTIEDYESAFWFFKKPLIIEIRQQDLIIRDNLIERLKTIKDDKYDILIVKTGICDRRDCEDFWNRNYGFHPDIYDLLCNQFKSIRVLGFDSISVSSLQDRMLGRESHLRFLNPQRPILLLEDMDLTAVTEETNFKEIIVAPLRIASCDGLPCTVIGKLNG